MVDEEPNVSHFGFTEEECARSYTLQHLGRSTLIGTIIEKQPDLPREFVVAILNEVEDCEKEFGLSRQGAAAKLHLKLLVDTTEREVQRDLAALKLNTDALFAKY